MNLADPIPRYDYASAIGTTMIAWSKLEAVFDMVVEYMYEHSNGNIIEPKRPQTSIKRKIDAVKKWYNHHLYLQTTNPWMPRHLTALKASADSRHYLAHGIYSHEQTIVKDKYVEVAAFTMKVKGEWKSQAFPIERLDGLATLYGLKEDLWRAFLKFVMDDKAIGPGSLADSTNNIAEKLVIIESAFYSGPNIKGK